MKYVFDGDNQCLLEKFEEHEKEAILKKYEENPLFEEVLEDREGDIIVYRESDED